MVSVEGRELVIRDLGNSFINHQWTQVWNQVCMKLPWVFILDPPTTWIKTIFLSDSRSYEFWRLSTHRSVWIPPAPTPPLPPSTSTTHMSELPCTSAPRPSTGSSAGNAPQQTWAIHKPAVSSYVSCHQWASNDRCVTGKTEALSPDRLSSVVTDWQYSEHTRQTLT